MKHTLLTCCILAATFSLAKAQVKQQAFKNQVGFLISAEHAHNVTLELAGKDTLNALMNKQIAYLGSYIKTLQARDNTPAYKKNKIAVQADAVLITKMTASLTTDNNLYNTIQQQMAAKAAETTINADYTAFADTLQ